MDDVRVELDESLTCTMGNVLQSKDDKLDASDSTPTSSTDASTVAATTDTATDDPISSTSSEVAENRNIGKIASSKHIPGDDTHKEMDISKSLLVTDVDLLDINMTDVHAEEINEDVEDIVQDLENLLGDPTAPYSLIKHKESLKTQREEMLKLEENRELTASRSDICDPKTDTAKASKSPDCNELVPDVDDKENSSEDLTQIESHCGKFIEPTEELPIYQPLSTETSTDEVVTVVESVSLNEIVPEVPAIGEQKLELSATSCEDLVVSHNSREHLKVAEPTVNVNLNLVTMCKSQEIDNVKSLKLNQETRKNKRSRENSMPSLDIEDSSSSCEQENENEGKEAVSVLQEYEDINTNIVEKGEQNSESGVDEELKSPKLQDVKNSAASDVSDVDNIKQSCYSEASPETGIPNVQIEERSVEVVIQDSVEDIKESRVEKSSTVTKSQDLDEKDVQKSVNLADDIEICSTKVHCDIETATLETPTISKEEKKALDIGESQSLKPLNNDFHGDEQKSVKEVHLKSVEKRGERSHGDDISNRELDDEKSNIIVSILDSAPKESQVSVHLEVDELKSCATIQADAEVLGEVTEVPKIVNIENAIRNVDQLAEDASVTYDVESISPNTILHQELELTDSPSVHEEVVPSPAKTMEQEEYPEACKKTEDPPETNSEGNLSLVVPSNDVAQLESLPEIPFLDEGQAVPEIEDKLECSSGETRELVSSNDEHSAAHESLHLSTDLPLKEKSEDIVEETVFAHTNTNCQLVAITESKIAESHHDESQGSTVQIVLDTVSDPDEEDDSSNVVELDSTQEKCLAEENLIDNSNKENALTCQPNGSEQKIEVESRITVCRKTDIKDTSEELKDTSPIPQAVIVEEMAISNEVAVEMEPSTSTEITEKIISTKSESTSPLIADEITVSDSLLEEIAFKSNNQIKCTKTDPITSPVEDTAVSTIFTAEEIVSPTSEQMIIEEVISTESISSPIVESVEVCIVSNVDPIVTEPVDSSDEKLIVEEDTPLSNSEQLVIEEVISKESISSPIIESAGEGIVSTVDLTVAVQIGSSDDKLVVEEDTPLSNSEQLVIEEIITTEAISSPNVESVEECIVSTVDLVVTEQIGSSDEKLIIKEETPLSVTEQMVIEEVVATESISSPIVESMEECVVSTVVDATVAEQIDSSDEKLIVKEAKPLPNTESIVPNEIVSSSVEPSIEEDITRSTMEPFKIKECDVSNLEQTVEVPAVGASTIVSKGISLPSIESVVVEEVKAPSDGKPHVQEEVASLIGGTIEDMAVTSFVLKEVASTDKEPTVVEEAAPGIREQKVDEELATEITEPIVTNETASVNSELPLVPVLTSTNTESILTEELSPVVAEPQVEQGLSDIDTEPFVVNEAAKVTTEPQVETAMDAEPIVVEEAAPVIADSNLEEKDAAKIAVKDEEIAVNEQPQGRNESDSTSPIVVEEVPPAISEPKVPINAESVKEDGETSAVTGPIVDAESSTNAMSRDVKHIDSTIAVEDVASSDVSEEISSSKVESPVVEEIYGDVVLAEKARIEVSSSNEEHEKIIPATKEDEEQEMSSNGSEETEASSTIGTIRFEEFDIPQPKSVEMKQEESSEIPVGEAQLETISERVIEQIKDIEAFNDDEPIPAGELMNTDDARVPDDLQDQTSAAVQSILENMQAEEMDRTEEVHKEEISVVHSSYSSYELQKAVQQIQGLGMESLEETLDDDVIPEEYQTNDENINKFEVDTIEEQEEYKQEASENPVATVDDPGVSFTEEIVKLAGDSKLDIEENCVVTEEQKTADNSEETQVVHQMDEESGATVCNTDVSERNIGNTFQDRSDKISSSNSTSSEVEINLQISVLKDKSQDNSNKISSSSAMSEKVQVDTLKSEISKTDRDEENQNSSEIISSSDSKCSENVEKVEQDSPIAKEIIRDAHQSSDRISSSDSKSRKKIETVAKLIDIQEKNVESCSLVTSNSKDGEILTRKEIKQQKHNKSERKANDVDLREPLSINIDEIDKEKCCSPKVTIKPIRLPEEVGEEKLDLKQGSLKITITKQSDNTHSILKICTPEDENKTKSGEGDEPTVPKLIIKPVIQDCEQQHSPKMSTRSSKQSTSNAVQRSGSPRVTIKPIIKPDKLEIISPVKITIKPVLKPDELVKQKHSPKLMNKSIKSDDEFHTSRRSGNAKSGDTSESCHSPRVTIKPIVKPPDELDLAPNSKVSNKAAQSELGKVTSPKITIKPVVKPTEQVSLESVDEEVKQRIVLKINKGSIPGKELRDDRTDKSIRESRKREHEDDKSEKLAKIKLKFSKGSDHPHIVQERNEEPQTSNRRTSDNLHDSEKTKSNKRSSEHPHESDKSKSSKRSSEHTYEIDKSKSNKRLSENPHDKSNKRQSDNPHDGEKTKKHKSAEETSKFVSKSEDHSDPRKREVISEDDDVHIIEEPKKSPIVISEDSTQDSVILVEEAKDPLSEIPVFEITPESVRMSVPSAIASPAPPPVPQHVPRKRGRPRKIPLVVREEFKDAGDLSTKEDHPVGNSAAESGRPKRSCRGQSARATLGIKPRKPKGPGRGRGGKRAMGDRAISMKPAKESKISSAKSELLKKSLTEEALDAKKGIYVNTTDCLSKILIAKELSTIITQQTDKTIIRDPLSGLKDLINRETKDADTSVKELYSVSEGISDVEMQPPTHVLAPTETTTMDIVMYEEETRMSAEANSRAQTPAKQVAADIVEESQSSVQSTATTESGKAGKKAARLEVHQEPEGAVISADQLAEYYWAGNGPFMLQEQVAQFLGIKSFKRKYPGISRRMVDMQERDFIRESCLASEAMCDLGLTAVNSADILDIMYSDFQDKYEEYRKHQRDRQAKDLINKQKALSLAASQERTKLDIVNQAIQSAAIYNQNFNKVRREQRRACMDLQTMNIHFPKGRMKQINHTNPGHYPVALVPGQFTDYYKEFTPTEINNLPINTMCYETINRISPEGMECDSDSDSSGSDSGSSSSDSDSDSSSCTESCKMCNKDPGKKTTTV